MSTLVSSAQVAGSAGTRPSGPAPAVTQRRVIRAEWIKLRSVRSMRVGFVTATAVAVGLGLVFTAAGVSDGPGPESRGSDPVSLSLAGFTVAQMIFGVLAVLAVTSEYSSGLIRTTLSAVTTRVPVLRAKAAVFGGVTLAAGAVAAVVAFLGGQAVYGGNEATASLADPTVLRVVLGTAVFTMGISLVGLALGFLLRSTAGGIGLLFGGLMILPNLAELLPDWSDPILRFLPSNAGAAFSSFRPTGELLSPTMGFVVFALWVVGLLAAAQVSLRVRDA